eukprot:3922913-Alexandrium_andersonii.AAC.1
MCKGACAPERLMSVLCCSMPPNADCRVAQRSCRLGPLGNSWTTGPRSSHSSVAAWCARVECRVASGAPRERGAYSLAVCRCVQFPAP